MDFFWAQHVLSVKDKLAETKIHFICFFSFSPYHSAHTGNISSELLHLPLYFLAWYEAWRWGTFSDETCVLLILLTCADICTHLYNTQHQHELPKMQLRIFKMPLQKTPSEGAYYKTWLTFELPNPKMINFLQHLQQISEKPLKEVRQRNACERDQCCCWSLETTRIESCSVLLQGHSHAEPVPVPEWNLIELFPSTRYKVVPLCQHWRAFVVLLFWKAESLAQHTAELPKAQDAFFSQLTYYLLQL